METQFRKLDYEEEREIREEPRAIPQVVGVFEAIARVLTAKSLFFGYLIGGATLFSYAMLYPEPLRLWIAGAYTVLNIPVLWIARKW